MPWSLYLALKQLFPSGKKASFFTVISVAGVCAGVWLMVAITGVMGGFGEKYRTMIVDTQGDAQVRALSLIPDPVDLGNRLSKSAEIQAVTPYAQVIAMIEYMGRPTFPGIQGVDINTVDNVVPIRRYISFGSLDDLDDDTVILSAGLAREIGVGVGSQVQVYAPTLLEKMKNDERALPTELTVVGIFEIGHQQLDSSLAIVTLRRMQDLYDLGNQVHGFNLKLKPGADVITVTQRLNNEFRSDPVVARTWMEANEAFLFALRLEKMMVTLITSFIVLIAMFLVTALLLITVVRKTREIGILGALGGKPRQIAACFCWQGLLVGVVGTILGLGLGFLTLANIDRIFRFIGWISGNWENLVAIYQFSEAPAHITLGEIAAIGIYAVAMTTLAGLIAAWRAAKLQIVEALRSE